jgi:hypothetical protein
VIPEIAIWRAATLMLKRYREKALDEGAASADELARHRVIARQYDAASPTRRPAREHEAVWQAPLST